MKKWFDFGSAWHCLRRFLFFPPFVVCCQLRQLKKIAQRTAVLPKRRRFYGCLLGGTGVAISCNSIQIAIACHMQEMEMWNSLRYSRQAWLFNVSKFCFTWVTEANKFAWKKHILSVHNINPSALIRCFSVWSMLQDVHYGYGFCRWSLAYQKGFFWCHSVHFFVWFHVFRRYCSMGSSSFEWH